MSKNKKRFSFASEALRLTREQPIKRQMMYVSILEAMRYLSMKDVARVFRLALELEAAEEEK